jgi:hypothetical protein
LDFIVIFKNKSVGKLADIGKTPLGKLPLAFGADILPGNSRDGGD